MWSRVARPVGVLLALLTPAIAVPAGAAEPAPAPAPLGAAPVAAAPFDAAAFDAALREADRRFVAGDLQGALAVLQPVCAGAGSAQCAFSLGAIHHGLGHCPEALAHYRRYLQLAPRGEHVPEVTEALEEVEGRCGAPASLAPALPAQVTPGPPPAMEASAGALAPPPPPAVEPSALARGLTAAAFVTSGAAAVSSVVFGVLAARSARRCERAGAYDQRFIDECEVRGPRYQGLWQGSAIASGAFLGIGAALWWSSSHAAPAGVSGASGPGLELHGRF